MLGKFPICVLQVFAWLGFAIAIVWIYAIANEIVNLLQVLYVTSSCIHSFDCGMLPFVCLCMMYIIQAFGIVVKLSDGILGITLLAWGNSIGGNMQHIILDKFNWCGYSIHLSETHAMMYDCCKSPPYYVCAVHSVVSLTT